MGEPFGIVCGVTLTCAAAVAFAAARTEIVAGVSTEDMTFPRFTVAGLIFLPLLLRWVIADLAGIGWRRGVVLLVCGGPLFVLLQTGGYGFAPLAHGAVIAPSMVMVLSTIKAGLFLGERLSLPHLIGAILVLLGILLLGWEGLPGTAGGRAWVGNLMFVTSSALWTGFTVRPRHWRLNAIRAGVAWRHRR